MNFIISHLQTLMSILYVRFIHTHVNKGHEENVDDG
jgi:hypothetical protein